MAHELSLIAIPSSKRPPVLGADTVNLFDSGGNQGLERSLPKLYTWFLVTLGFEIRQQSMPDPGA